MLKINELKQMPWSRPIVVHHTLVLTNRVMKCTTLWEKSVEIKSVKRSGRFNVGFLLS